MRGVLVHHGIKGQEWGVQHGPPYPLDAETNKMVRKSAEKEFRKMRERSQYYRDAHTIPAGTTMYRMSVNPNETLDGHKYVTYIDEDRDSYRSGIGDGITPNTLSIVQRRHERINRTIDLHGATPHIFRHSFATMLYDTGADIKTIQSIMGQSDFKTTADRYCHPRSDRNQAAVSAVQNLIFQ